MKITTSLSKHKKNILTLSFYSVIGIFVFFVPVSINGKSTIPLDHIITGIRQHFPRGAAWYALMIVIAGALEPFYDKNRRNDLTAVSFSVLKIFGAVIGVLFMLNMLPEALLAADMTPFLYKDLAIPVGIIVPVGAIFLAFLVDFGLLEFIGVFMEPVMKPIWKTPGRSAIDAVASFVGSYSIGLLITNRVFKEGKYTVKEAAIIATGFSTVSATFMVIVAKTCGVMDIWNIYFWSTLVITFLVTAITVRLYPLKNKSNSRLAQPEMVSREKGALFKRALRAGLDAFDKAPKLRQSIWENLRDGLLMAMRILPSIMSVGLLGLLLAKYTALFDIIGYLFWPVVRLMHMPEGLLAGKAAAVGIAEMFLPSLLVGGASLVTRFTIAVTSVSSILFFSASIPCIFSTEIPVNLKDVLIIWFERTFFSLIFAAGFAWLIVGLSG